MKAIDNECQNRMMATARKIFIREVETALPQAHNDLSVIKTGHNPGCINDFYRFAHTLKGSGQMVGLRDIADPAFEVETVLRLIKDYNVPITSGLVDFLCARLSDIEEEVTRLKSETEELPSEDKPISTKKVLVVDDDPVVVQLVEERLAREGLKVTVCRDTWQADHSIAAEQPDIILLDIVLPGESGVEFCRRIRSQEATRLIPIVFFTVKGELQDKLAGFATGADDYLPKPFAMEELVARVHAILNRVEALSILAWRDGLTGLYNRGYFDHRLNEEILYAKRKESTFSLAMIDLDLFKNVNDIYGHASGDNVLKLITASIARMLRNTDIICRYGGDEFVVIFRDTSYLSAQTILERLKEEIGACSVGYENKTEKANVTLSIGVATYPKDGHTKEELLSAADSAMYQAKKAGGNKVVAWGDTCGSS